MLKIENNKQKEVNTKEYICGNISSVMILTEKDLKNIDWCLCGQRFDVCIVPRELTEKEKSYIKICMLSYNGSTEGTIRILKNYS